MSTIVTGGAGFIGSCVVRALNDRGLDDIVVVDNIGSTEKRRNLLSKRYREYVHKDAFLSRLVKGDFDPVERIVHMGACSSTTEANFDYLYQNNLNYTQALWQYCREKGVPFVYASSAATYGDGSLGFDDRAPIGGYRPMNGYGYSKHLFDLWAERQLEAPPQHVGLKFFNVYGPNEYYKGSMASMAFHGYRQIRSGGCIRLFRSCDSRYEDGLQLRDFVYVKDVCRVILYFLDHPDKSGLFNVGTGRAQSFLELAQSVFAALGTAERIEFIDMPEGLREKYQYYTKAETEKLRQAGYTAPFLDVRAGVGDYVENHLSKGFLNW